MNHSYRNEAVFLRYLLKSACRLLDMYGIELPTELSMWWASRKTKPRTATVTFSTVSKKVRQFLDEYTPQ